MSPELIQKGIALTLITGGVGGGYFALISTGEGTLEQKRLTEKRELHKEEEWDAVVNKYKEEDNKGLIDEVSKTSSKLKENLKKWCSSKGNTYFTGATDQTYHHYYIWCLKDVTIEVELARLKINLDSNHWDKKLDKYKKSGQKFIVKEELAKDKQTTPVEESALTQKHIQDWCTTNKAKKYRYLGDDTEYRVRTYCYLTEEDMKEANKSLSTRRTG